MKDRLCLDFNYIFNDHMAKCSDQAKLYYIKLMFFATNGFVANPISVLDEMKYDKGVFYELVKNDELLVLPGRDEVFITAYFIHTGFNPASWLNTPFATYWRGKLRTKSNGVATFSVPKEVTEEELENRKAEEGKFYDRVSGKIDDKTYDWDQYLDKNS